MVEEKKCASSPSPSLPNTIDRYGQRACVCTRVCVYARGVVEGDGGAGG